MGRLVELVEAARDAAEKRSRSTSIAALEAQIAARPSRAPFKEALVRPGLSVIAEFKRGSPSAGEIRAGASVAEIVAGYERAGAAALSILTDERNFRGSLGDLRSARAESELPILRKDFIVDGYQVLEAAAAGADAVLLIVAALNDRRFAELYAQTRDLDLDCLVEVHDETELERALALDIEVIGINNRNLDTLEVDTETTPELMASVPAGKTVVAESGYRSRDEIEELERIGVDAVLIGETLMRAPDPEAQLRWLTRDEGSARERSA